MFWGICLSQYQAVTDQAAWHCTHDMESTPFFMSNLSSFLVKLCDTSFGYLDININVQSQALHYHSSTLTEPLLSYGDNALMLLYR